MKLDKLNLKILQALQTDARISNLKLSEVVALSESGCLNRVKKLQRDGLIDSYRAHINLNKVRHVHFIISVGLKSQDIGLAQNFKAAINKIPQIVTCYKVSGEYDYMMHYYGRDAQEFNRITEDLLARDLGIDKMTSQLVIEDTKPFEGYPLDILYGDDQPTDAN